MFCSYTSSKLSIAWKKENSYKYRLGNIFNSGTSRQKSGKMVADQAEIQLLVSYHHGKTLSDPGGPAGNARAKPNSR